MDAKHSHPNDIERRQLPYLVYKYLFSIKAISADESVYGLCILCGKTDGNKQKNLYDIAQKLNINIYPKANICSITGSNVNDNEPLVNYIKEMEKEINL